MKDNRRENIEVEWDNPPDFTTSCAGCGFPASHGVVIRARGIMWRICPICLERWGRLWGVSP